MKRLLLAIAVVAIALLSVTPALAEVHTTHVDHGRGHVGFHARGFGGGFVDPAFAFEQSQFGQGQLFGGEEFPQQQFGFPQASFGCGQATLSYGSGVGLGCGQATLSYGSGVGLGCGAGAGFATGNYGTGFGFGSAFYRPRVGLVNPFFGVRRLHLVPGLGFGFGFIR